MGRALGPGPTFSGPARIQAYLRLALFSLLLTDKYPKNKMGRGEGAIVAPWSLLLLASGFGKGLQLHSTLVLGRNFISKFLISNFSTSNLLIANTFNMEGRHLVNVFGSNSNISEKDPQNQDLFEDANQDNDQISVSSDGSVSFALSLAITQSVTKMVKLMANGNNGRSISRQFSGSFYSLSDSIGCFAGKLIPENVFLKGFTILVITKLMLNFPGKGEMAFKEEHDGRIKAEERNKV